MNLAPVVQPPVARLPSTRTIWLPLVAGVGGAAIASAAPGWSGALSLLWVALATCSTRFPFAGLAIVALAAQFEQRAMVPTLIGDVSMMAFTVSALAAGALPRLARVRALTVDRIAAAQIAMLAVLAASFAAGDVSPRSWTAVMVGWLMVWIVYVLTCSLLMSVRSPRLVDRGRTGTWPRGVGVGDPGVSRQIAVNAIVVAIAVGVVVNAAFAVWQLATAAGPSSFQVEGVVRVFGTFRHPNTLAAWLVVVLPPLVALVFVSRVSSAWVARVAAVMGGATLLLTQSRGGMLAFAAAMLAMTVVAPLRVRRWAVAFGVLVLVAVVASGVMERLPVAERFSTIAPGGEPAQVTSQTWGQREREAHWGAALAMVRADPVFGVGAGEFNDNYRTFTPEWRFRVGRGHAHNGYLHLGAEAGVPGLLAFSAWIGTIFLVLWRRVSRTVGMDFALVVGAIGAATAWAVDNLFEYPDVRSIPITFAMLIALGVTGVASTPAGSPRVSANGVEL